MATVKEVRERVESNYKGYDTSAMLGHSEEMQQALEDLKSLLYVIDVSRKKPEGTKGEGTRYENVLGRTAKAWATRLMKLNGWTREQAREHILKVVEAQDPVPVEEEKNDNDSTNTTIS